MTEITYITIDETHRIEVMPSGNHYPQCLTQPTLKEYSEGWSYWKTGNTQKHFKTERGARKFLAQQDALAYRPQDFVEQDCMCEACVADQQSISKQG